MNNNLLNIGLICDVTWDNYILIDKKIKKLDAENYRLHRIYNKQIILETCSNNNSVYLIRHSGEKITNILINLIKVCKIFIIFTNSIEYLTASSLIIEMCKYYNIPYIIVSEHNRDNDFYSIKNEHKTFKKFIYNFKINNGENKSIENKNGESTNCESTNNKIKSIDNLLNIYTQDEIDKFDNLFANKYYKHINLTEDIINKLRSTYISAENKRKENSIKLLYDKEQLKVEKLTRRHNKEYKQLVFANNRINYYKTSPTRTPTPEIIEK